jgi:hypothetical protein
VLCAALKRAAQLLPHAAPSCCVSAGKKQHTHGLTELSDCLATVSGLTEGACALGQIGYLRQLATPHGMDACMQ